MAVPSGSPPPRPRVHDHPPVPPPRPRPRGESLTADQHRRHLALGHAIRAMPEMLHQADVDTITDVADRFLDWIEHGPTPEDIDP